VLYNNPAYDELVTRARQFVDHEERRQVYFQAQQMLLDEVPVIPLWNGKNIEALSPNLQDYRQSYTGRRLFSDKTWIQS
jgi:ABC-type transport system substrate-binding protein